MYGKNVLIAVEFYCPVDYLSPKFDYEASI